MAHAAEPLRVMVASDDPHFRESLASTLNERGAKAEAAAAPDEALLAKADVLVLFSNEPRPLPLEKRAALEAFAKRGGGFVVVRGGIATGDAAWWKPLIGGAWAPQSRKFANRMMLYTTTDSHPIVRNASPFDVDDETLYDLDLAQDLHVLGSAFTPKVTSKREDPRSPERADRANIYDLQPQMWAFEAPATEGASAHRAFVALQGSATTLEHTSFRSFLLRGIAWAAQREDADELCRAEELATLRYPKDGPSRAEDTVRQLEVHPGFQVSVVASEPLISKPIAMNWDASGRLWVAETPEYPNGRRPTITEPWKETGVLKPGVYDRPATDRISILTDTDGDGVMDQKTVFYEGLELVTGFCFYRDGIIALHQPDIVWLRDTDGDGKADKIERLFTGFTPGDTHFVANHLTPGADGWIYVSMGGSEDVRKPDGKEVVARVSSGVFRFKPDGSAIEQFSSKGGNGFGLDVTSDFEVFFGQATSGNPIQHVVLPESVLARGKVGQTNGAQSVLSQKKLLREKLPDRAALMQIDVVGGFSSACASLIYEGGAWPAAFARGAFCTEPILNVIRHEALRADGPTYAGELLRKDKEFLFSRDYWFRPFDLATGPDGAMYVLDFYSPVVAHSDSRGPQQSRSGASIRPDREHYFGRIYRIQHEQAKPLEVPDLSKADAAALAQTFTHPNRTVRNNAFRLLVDQGGADAVAALQPLAVSEQPEARILALWALHRLGALQPEQLAAAFQGDAAVRKNAALIAEATPAAVQGPISVELVRMLKEGDERERIVALRALSAGALSAPAAEALVAAYPRLRDDWSRSAAAATAAANPTAVLEAALQQAKTDDLQEFIAAVAARIVEKQDPAAAGQLIVAAAAAPGSADPVKRVLLEAAAALKQPPGATPALTAALRTLLTSANPEIAAATLPLAAQWSPELRTMAAERIAPLIAELGNAATPERRRMQLASALVGARAISADALPALTRALTGAASSTLKKHVITALNAAGDAASGEALLTAFPQLTPAEQDLAFNALLARPDWTGAFLAAMEKGDLAPNMLGPSNVFRLRTHPVKEIAARATQLLDSVRKASPDKEALLAKLLPVVTQPGNAVKGREIFTSACATCHKFNDLGTEVGPVLTGMGAHGAGNLLVHIVDPNRAVDAGYEVWNIETDDGQYHSGMLAQENDTRLVLKMLGTQVEVLKDRVKSRVNTHRSLMPEGFEALGDEALRDLLTFLSEGTGRYRVIDLGNAFTADARRGLYQSADALNDTIRFKRFGLQNVENIPFHLMDPEKNPVGGSLVVLKGGGREAFAHRLPQRVEIPVGFSAQALHFLSGVAGWGNREGKVPAMKVTVVFADGQAQVEELRTGEVFIDYPSGEEVPGSRRAEGLTSHHHIRLFTLPIKHPAAIQKVVLESYDNGIAPTTAAITAELPGQ